VLIIKLVVYIRLHLSTGLKRWRENRETLSDLLRVIRIATAKHVVLSYTWTPSFITYHRVQLARFVAKQCARRTSLNLPLALTAPCQRFILLSSRLFLPLPFAVGRSYIKRCRLWRSSRTVIPTTRSCGENAPRRPLETAHLVRPQATALPVRPPLRDVLPDSPPRSHPPELRNPTSLHHRYLLLSLQGQPPVHRSPSLPACPRYPLPTMTSRLLPFLS
jgi:hypothetical protein